MPNDNTHTGKWMTVDELANFIRIVDGNHDKGAGAIAEELLPMIEARLPRTPAEPKAVDWDAVLLDTLLYSQGHGIKTPPHEDPSDILDEYEKSIPDGAYRESIRSIRRALSSAAPRITERDIADAMLRADFADKPDSEGNMEHFTRFVSASTRRAMAEYLSGRASPAPLSGITEDSDKSDLPIANSVQISEEMVEGVYRGVITDSSVMTRDMAQEMRNRLIALLRQQGAEGK